MKGILRRVPGLVTTYRHAQHLSAIAYERWWADLQRLSDRSILEGEWNFEAPPEQERYRRVLAAVATQRGTSSWGDALEIGCAEGLFTGELLRRCATVAAYDVSHVACERTARTLPELRVERRNIERDPVSGLFDLVFMMGVLGYVHGRGRIGEVTAKVADALRPGGLLVFNELRIDDSRFENCWWARAFAEGGLQLLKFLDGRDGLRLIHREIHRKYVIGIYEKTARNLI